MQIFRKVWYFLALLCGAFCAPAQIVLSGSGMVMKKEIEIKIQLQHEQLCSLKNWLSEHAQYTGTILHTEWYLDNPNDTFFFTAPDGYRDALKYLRVRHTEQGDSVAYKLWYCDPGTGKTTHCDEYETRVDNAQVMLALFAQLGYSNQTKIVKVRESYTTNDFEIVIDQIENLGFFVEIEIVRPHEDVNVSLCEIYSFLKSIGIMQFTKQDRGYVSMFWNPGTDFGTQINLDTFNYC